MNRPRPPHRRVAAMAVPIALITMIATVLAGCGNSASSGSSTSASSTSSTAGDGATTSTPASELNAAAGLDANGCITNFDLAADYFPVKSQIDYATNFTVEYDKSYQVLTVVQPTQGGSPESYVLVKCGAPTPPLTGDLAGATVVSTPVSSLYSGSTTHLPNLVALDRPEVLTGVASKSLISEKEVLDRVAEPGVVEYAAAGTVDAEAVVAGKPDVVITAGTDDPAYAVISAAGIPVLADAEWLENDPLGRAEWIKYFAALTGTEAQAADYFDAVDESYTALADKVVSADPVQVVPGQPYQGTWYVPGGQSFNSHLIADAGGTTAWADDPSTGSVSTDLESVLAKAGKAPVWLASTTWTTKAEALAEEPRFSEFAAFQSGNVWNAAKDVTAEGGNNYYELGIARPDLVLGDLVAIMHPDLMPGHDFAFYLQLS